MKPLTPIRLTKHPKYKYVLDADLVVQSPYDLGAHDFMDEFGKVWLEMRGRTLTVKKGYAWDGASCAPDFPDVIVASCVHDCLIQFSKVPCFPLKKSQIDAIFRDLMPSRFCLRWIYWGAVRTFGGAYSALSANDPRTASCGLPHRK